MASSGANCQGTECKANPPACAAEQGIQASQASAGTPCLTWVAIPAWSVPGSHRVGRPLMRAVRAMISCRAAGRRAVTHSWQDALIVGVCQRTAELQGHHRKAPKRQACYGQCRKRASPGP